ncbi:MAG: PEGA domain-containing protein [Spirochaetota bacterium]
MVRGEPEGRKLRRALWALLLAAAMIAAVQAPASELFINTDPIGAEVYFGLTRMGTTPLRLTGLEPGTVRITVDREGYARVRETVELEGVRTQSLYYDLVPRSLDLILSQAGKEVVINQVTTGTAPLLVKNIPNGIYRLENTEERISIENAEYARMKRAALIEALVSSGLFAASLAGAFHYEPQGGGEVLNVSAVIFGGLTGYNLIKLARLHTEEQRDRLGMSAIQVTPYNREEDREIFSAGADLVGREQWQQALARFNLLINVYPSSGFVPLSVYEIGYCYYRMDSLEKAAREFRRYVYELPAVEFFPYALYYLLETLAVQGNHRQALADYRALRPLYLHDRSAELLEDYTGLLTGLYDRIGGEQDFLLEDLLREIDYFLERFADSPALGKVLELRERLLARYRLHEEPPS